MKVTVNGIEETTRDLTRQLRAGGLIVEKVRTVLTANRTQ